jgi:glycosyltransferase involved in cell wall biosynthesis
MASQSPALTVITPVYNGERYLAECIQSVLQQTRRDFEYIIVDNCSTDRSVEIAEQYAAQDSRIRIARPNEFVNVHRNFARGAHLMNPNSRYCKFICADDWMYPECLERMADVAERHPSVGIVSSYVLVENRLDHDGLLDYKQTVMPGKEVIRTALLGGPYVTGGQSQLLFRSDLVREHELFFDEAVWHTDTDAAYRTLTKSDLGFVHQVLTYTRLHPNALTSSFSHRVNTYVAHDVRMLIRYGEVLSPTEYQDALSKALRKYVWFLGKQRLKPSRHRDSQFHAFHHAEIGRMLAELGDHPRARTVLEAARLLLRNARTGQAHKAAGDETGKSPDAGRRVLKA